MRTHAVRDDQKKSVQKSAATKSNSEHFQITLFWQFFKWGDFEQFCWHFFHFLRNQRSRDQRLSRCFSKILQINVSPICCKLSVDHCIPSTADKHPKFKISLFRRTCCRRLKIECSPVLFLLLSNLFIHTELNNKRWWLCISVFITYSSPVYTSANSNIFWWYLCQNPLFLFWTHQLAVNFRTETIEI